MKRFVIIFFLFSIFFNLNARVSFVPSFDIFSLITFKSEKPYVKPSFDANVNFNIQAFRQSYFDIGFNLVVQNPLEVLYFDKTKRKPINALFLTSALTFPTINGKNIYLAVFYGLYDYLNSDKILRETAKVKMQSSDFHQHFPTSVFKPDLKIDNLGFAIYGSLNPIPAYFASYAHWNGNYTKEGFKVGLDFRTGYAFTSGALNAFFGVSFGNDLKAMQFRAGVSATLNVNEQNEFYFDVGVDKIGVQEKEAYKKFYALFEPRILYDKFSLSIPFFMAPVSSLPSFIENATYKDSSFAGLGLKLAGGNLEKYNMEGGVSICTTLNPKKPSELTAFTFVASPFFTCAFSNYVLDFRVNIYPVLYKNPENMVNLSIQFKAVR